jgi:hypothetical protein
VKREKLWYSAICQLQNGNSFVFHIADMKNSEAFHSAFFTLPFLRRDRQRDRDETNLSPANCIRSECRTSNACPYIHFWMLFLPRAGWFSEK